jgi:hypothetical protein
MQTIKNNIRKKASLTVVMVVMFFMSSFQEITGATLNMTNSKRLVAFLHQVFFPSAIPNELNTTAVGSYTQFGVTTVIIAVNGINIPNAANRARFAQNALRRAIGINEANNGRYRIFLITGTTAAPSPLIGIEGFGNLLVYTLPYPNRPVAGVHAEMAVVFGGYYIANPQLPGTFVIVGNRPYCSHCHLYLTRTLFQFIIRPGFVNLRTNPSNWQHPVPFANQLGNGTGGLVNGNGLILTANTLACEEDHNILPNPTFPFKIEESDDGHNHLEGEDLEKESIEGLETDTGQKLAVFPNPILDNGLIKCFDCTVGSTISIYDVTGNLKREIQWKDEGGQSMPIDLSSFTKGIYLLRTENPNGESKTRKLVKN